MDAQVDLEQQRRALVGTTARLVEFLRDLARTGKSTVRDVAAYGGVRWLADVPVGIDIDTSAGSGDVLLSLDPVPSEPPPPPPATLARWINVDDVYDSSLEQPELDEEMPAELRTPQALAEYHEWVDRWRVWAEADHVLAHRRDWFSFLAHAHRLLDQQDDTYELVLGTGVLTWRRPAGLIRHPLLTTRVDLVNDPVTGRIDAIIGHDAGTRLCDRQLLDDEPSFNAGRAETLRDELRSSPPDPLSDEIKELLERWRFLTLDRARPYEHTWDPCEAADSDPDLRFAPVLILRERDRTSLIDYYDRMLAALSGPDAVAPLGLAQLLTALEPDERLAWLEAEGAADAELLGSDPLFPLPSNPEQRQIIERLRSNSGVAVMGPPGTGKTHTIANLLSALLARGQRVLVTSQKAQALRVLRDKLPQEVQKLCVSMTDVKRGGSKELDASVTALSDRYANFNEAAYQERVRKALDDRHAARTRVAQLTERLREIREAETVSHPPIAEGYQGTLEDIAERLRSGRDRHAWIPVPFPNDAPFAAPLSSAEFEELRGLLATQTTRRAARTNQVLPDRATIPTGAAVRADVAAEAAATTEARSAATQLSEELRLFDENALVRLRELLTAFVSGLQRLGLPPDPTSWPDDWRTRAIADGLAGREAGVWAQLARVAPHAHEAQSALASIGLRQVTLPRFEATGPNSFLGQLQAGQALRAHLAGGNELRKRFRPAVQRQAERLLEGAAVDGVPISNLATLDVVLALMTAENVAAQLASHWATVGVTLDRSLPLQRVIAQLVDRANELAVITELISTRDALRSELGARQVALPLAAPSEIHALLCSLDAVEARIQAERATAELNNLAERLELDARHPAAPPELADLAAALSARDVDRYESTLHQLAGAFAEQAEQRRCNELWARLNSAHPSLAAMLRTTAANHEWEGRSSSFAQAWAWGRAQSWFDAQRDEGVQERLTDELHEAINRVSRATAELVAEEAWGQCLKRMTARQEQALRSYKDNIDQIGAGQGKFKDRYAAAARQAMVEARGAVPAWIMPLREVVDTIPPDQNSFDVVIVDEASQASIEALFLLWLAPRVIVVGDDRQCAPSQVIRGELQPIFDRLDDYLADVPEYLRLAFTPKSNLFSLLGTRFGGVVRLREHFRCMPEIITWSSKQFYADTPLVPLRQFGADRLPPLRTVYVPNAVTEGSSARLHNQAEAEAIVARVVECLNDPAYENRTFGVVVLQGSGQVRLIEDLLTEAVHAAEWERRRLRIGTPPDFQGDERDVIFLSMVAAERRPALTAREWQRRFNVAASRAKDQMWLFHSVKLDMLSPKDLRRSLLSYMLNPPAPLTTGAFDDLHWDSELREPFQSKFEQRVFIALRDRGYHVTPQYEVNGKFIDLVVTGAKGRLAVECDGAYHESREQQIADMDRELELRRAGWQFWRVRGSEFYLDPEKALSSLWEALEQRGIRPGDLAVVEGPESSEAEAWEQAPLSDEEGLDGLDGDDPSELDVNPYIWHRGSHGAPRASRSSEPEAIVLDLSSDVTTAEIRRWARRNGMQVGERGRLHPDIIRAWNRAHPDRPY